MSLSVSRPTPRPVSHAASAVVEAPQHTPVQERAGKVAMGAYAIGVAGGFVAAVGSLVVMTGAIATGIYDKQHGTSFSDALLAHSGSFETAMTAAAVLIGTCAAVMVASLGVFGGAGLAERLRRGPKSA